MLLQTEDVLETPKFSQISSSGSIPGETLSHLPLNNFDFYFRVVQHVNKENQALVIRQESKAYLQRSTPSILRKMMKAVMAWLLWFILWATSKYSILWLSMLWRCMNFFSSSLRSFHEPGEHSFIYWSIFSISWLIFLMLTTLSRYW